MKAIRLVATARLAFTGRGLACRIEWQRRVLAFEPPRRMLFAPWQFRVAPASIAFNRAAGAVFASGAFRTAGWSLASMPITDEASGALMTGRPGLVLVEKSQPTPAAT